MKTVVYADVLVVINIIVNYFLLRASAAVISFDFKAWRFLVSSALGGAFSLIIFVDGLPAAALAAVKFLFLLLMVLAAFGYGSFKRDFEYDYLEGTEFVIYAPEEGREISANVYDAEANKVFTITAVRHGDMVEVSYTGTDKSFSVKVAGGEAVKVNPTAGGKIIIKL